MNEALIHSKYAVVAHLHAAEILQPGDGALDFPATPITAQLSSILVAAQNAVTPIGNNKLDASPFQASRIGSLSYPLSATTRSGFIRGRPRPGRGTRITCASVLSANLCSDGLAFAS